MSFMLSAHVTDEVDTHGKLYALLSADGPDFEHTRYTTVRGPRPALRIERGVDEYRIALCADGKWRWGSLTTYGNWSGVYGVGCDASGYVLHDEVAELAQDVHDFLKAEGK